MTSKQILIADDEPKMRRVLEIMLQNLGHRVLSAANGREALELFTASGADLVLTDLFMPQIDGIELLKQVRKQDMTVPIIVITAHGTIETAVAAMKHGAFDYLVRPFDIEVLELAISRALDESAFARQNAFLREEIERGVGEFVGDSAPMRAVYELIRQVAPSKAAVLIYGETGTGKELVARAIHNASPRHDKLFVPINCAAIPAEMLESELFGYEKGAFTGAQRERVGKFELADGGTVFLDEVTEMAPPLQVKLLRVLQENVVERLGGNRRIPLDIRLIAATNREPQAAVVEGRLREDLYYRINVFGIGLPPLRDRLEDIPMLVKHFTAKHGLRDTDSASGAVVQLLSTYSWPGNVRELENMVERALILSAGKPIEERHFSLPQAAATAAAAPAQMAVGSLNAAVSQLETRLIAAALAEAKGSKSRAAALLEISERTLWYKLKKYRMEDAP